MASAPITAFTAEPLAADVQRALARLARRNDVVAIAVMPDVHLAREVCIGTVVATANALMPEAVGGDIGCGMAAVRLDAAPDALADRAVADAVLTGLAEAIPTARHRTADAALPADLAETALSAPVLEAKKARIGRVQLGSLGRGNHFVEVQRCEAGALWLMLHSGSRGMGQAIRDHHSRGGPIAADSLAGAAYLADLDWALTYAAHSRRRMAEAAADVVQTALGARADWTTYVDCHHNFVRREHYRGAGLWVHRKGAISAREGEPGIIPGSMGSASFHVTGRGCTDALQSSSHGAGRVLSRTDARRAVSVDALERRMRGVWFDHRIANRLRDEAPQAYKDIGAVMRAQRKLTRIVRRLEPVLVYKGT